MTSPAAEKLLTAEEYAKYQEPPGMRSELVCGRVLLMPPADTRHGAIGRRIDRALGDFADAHRLGEVTGEGGYRLTREPDTLRAPDAAFISWARLPGGRLPSQGYVEGAPDLAVEVISPSEVEADVALKVQQFLDAGALRVWEVRPRLQTVTVHRSGAAPRTYGDGDALSSDDAGFAVEGFALPLHEIFGSAGGA
jgi:Uma2 family endonuclease